MFISVAFASDIKLGNPAAQDFDELNLETKNTGNLVRKNSAINDRAMPSQIRQVSAESNDPFPMGTQSPTQSPPFDWGTAAPVAPNNQYHVAVDPQAAGYGYPRITPEMMQEMQNMYLASAGMGYAPQFAQQQFAQQQFAQPQFTQYPQQYVMPGMNPYGFGDPYNQFAQSGLAQSGLAQSGLPGYQVADPYGMYLANYQPDNQGMPDQQALYQALLLQARWQADEEERGSNGKRQEADEAKKQADANWTFNNLVPVRVSSPLGETLFACAKTISPFCTPSGPDKGVGMPLVNKSWQDHPWYVGGFVGRISGSELVSQMIEQKNGATGGFTVGYNFSDYWGLESRLHLAAIDIYDTDYARRLVEEASGGSVILLPVTRTNNLTMFDASVHYYPLGNAKWRPYFKYGLGIGRQKFTHTFGNQLSEDIVTMPLGMGMRYWWNERIAIQADLVDNIVFASGIAKTQNNVAFTVGLTYAFGNGKKKSPVLYWPTTPSMGSKW
jgi:hypothetical protein